MGGRDAGCIECRNGTLGACEFDGKFSFTRFRGRYLLFARANINRGKGGRFVQVAVSKDDDPSGDYQPFTLLNIFGYKAAQMQNANIYFASVQPNPIDEQNTLLGLFPVALDKQLRPPNTFNRLIEGVVALSISCDGIEWAPLVALAASAVTESRLWDQPVDGFVRHGPTVFALIHKNVPGIAGKRRGIDQPRAALAQINLMHGNLLPRLTSAAHQHLPACLARQSQRRANR